MEPRLIEGGSGLCRVFVPGRVENDCPLQPVALLGILSAIGLVVTLPFCAWELAHGARV